MVVAWGGPNSYGEITVPAGLSDVVNVAAGLSFNLALKGDGTVVAWGENTDGQTNVTGGLSNVVAIAGGGGYGRAPGRRFAIRDGQRINSSRLRRHSAG